VNANRQLTGMFACCVVGVCFQRLARDKYRLEVEYKRESDRKLQALDDKERAEVSQPAALTVAGKFWS
jgi:hypothetical protein